MFKLEIRTSNAAFDGGAKHEVAAVLRRVADRVASGEIDGNVMDRNGNRVGEFFLDEEGE